MPDHGAQRARTSYRRSKCTFSGSAISTSSNTNGPVAQHSSTAARPALTQQQRPQRRAPERKHTVQTNAGACACMHARAWCTRRGERARARARSTHCAPAPFARRTWRRHTSCSRPSCTAPPAAAARTTMQTTRVAQQLRGSPAPGAAAVGMDPTARADSLARCGWRRRWRQRRQRGSVVPPTPAAWRTTTLQINKVSAVDCRPAAHAGTLQINKQKRAWVPRRRPPSPAINVHHVPSIRRDHPIILCSAVACGAMTR